MPPEAEARRKIDALLTAAGWVVQDWKAFNIGAGLGVAIREFPLKTGVADYMLFVGKKAVGVVEAKPEGTTLSGVAEQSGKYLVGLPVTIPHVGDDKLPFAYESTGVETFFRDERDPAPRSRRLFAFHQPETLHAWLAQKDTLRARLRAMPPLATLGLRDCQVEAITNLERSLADDRPRALIQMATGSGKTFTAVSTAYRLLKFGNARRVLFLVDRRSLGKQTLQEFQQFVTPDDGRKFTELYNVQHLTSNTLDPVARVCITTIQRLYSMLRGEAELDPDLEEGSSFEALTADAQPKEVSYDPAIPLENFDVIVTDECHRSIYKLWRQVLEYFDAHLIGLTATPSKQTIGFFNSNLVMEYNHERAVADGVNVGYQVFRIRTRITDEGSTVEAGLYVDRRDRHTRAKRWEQLDEDLEYGQNRLDRDVVAVDQIRTVLRAFKEKLFTDIFPGRTEVPKTLIFAKDDSHAEDIVGIIREEFGKGNDFAKKITYRTQENTDTLIAAFRNSYNPRIAVTVDMISTGTDIRPLECLLFMRDVRSSVYFDQMKGRGTRVISPTDFKAVTPDADHKTHFVIVDAVGVCETDKTETRPLERKPTVAFGKLIVGVAMGVRDADTLVTLAGRLARLDRELEPADRQELQQAAGGAPLKSIINQLLDAVDPDAQVERAQAMFGAAEPTTEQVTQAAEALADEACAPFEDPTFRNTLQDVKTRSEQTLDTVSQDEVLFAGFDEAARERAQGMVTSFKEFIETHKDELVALQILYNQPHGRRHLTHTAVKELAQAISRPPLQLDADKLWQAYARLEASKVKRAGPQRLLTDIVALVRFAIGESAVLEPFFDTVSEQFSQWLTRQQAGGRSFSPEQLEWLRMIKEHIAANLTVEVEDFEYVPFQQKGGPVRARQVFGAELDGLLAELNEVLAA
jgi:type I restriction enzyme R subunit